MKVRARVRLCRYGWYVEFKEGLVRKWEKIVQWGYHDPGLSFTYKTRAEAQERADAIERGEL